MSPTGRVVIALQRASKNYYHYDHRHTSLQQAVLGWARKRPPAPAPGFHLEQLSLTITGGESVGLIGGNGSGKSSLLRLIAGIYPASAGSVSTVGRVVPVIELGATFQPELTGIENIELYGVSLGVPRVEVLGRVEEYLAFAEVEDFAHVPLKYYSSGMRTRLAFAIAVKSRPDILLLDEVLAVGDERFRMRCTETVRAFHEQGGTMVLASHDLDTLPEIVERCVWMEGGRIAMDGDAREVIQAYRTHPN